MTGAIAPQVGLGRRPKDMAWVPGGTFRMGDERFYPEERPVHRVAVDGFWIDEHPSPWPSSGVSWRTLVM